MRRVNTISKIAIIVTTLGFVTSCMDVKLGRSVGAADPSFEGLSPGQIERMQRVRDRLSKVSPKKEVQPEERMQPRIVGGEPAEPGDYPWAVSLAFIDQNGSLRSYCGGSLIGAEWVLTAAHCDVRVGEKVILGRHDLTTNEGEVHDVVQVINHASYNSDTNDSDIALVKLDSPSTQTPISLVPSPNSLTVPNNNLTVVGWGHLLEGGISSDVLMEVTVPILSNQTCQTNYDDLGWPITGNMLCAGRTGQDSCQGDSGGPAMVVDIAQDMDRLAGVVSFGRGCARQGRPGVYTRVSQFIDWIHDNADLGTPAAPPPPPPPPPSAGPSSTQIPVSPAPTKGTISEAGTENLFEFTVETQGSYTIQTTGETSTVDTVMSLFGPNSQTILIQQNDDMAPGNYNSRIEESLVPGTYFVKVRLYHSNQVGNYTILVQAHE